MSSTRQALIEAAESVERRVDDASWRLKKRLHLARPLIVLPMRGFGDHRRLSFRARVLEDKRLDKPSAEDGAWSNLVRMLHRYASGEVRGVPVRVRFGDRVLEARSGADGFIEVELDVDLAPDPPAAERWRSVELELLDPDAERPVRATAEVLTPPRSAELGVISDLDDTVVETGATRLLRQARTVLLNNARTRTAFAGLPELYRALERGRAGSPKNPIFYVSSSPWNLYDLFEDFLVHHDIPRGPMLLKNFGLGQGKLFKGSHDGHKLEAIEAVLARYPHLEFVLVGDSGQRDVEIYGEVVARHPGRIRATYIRDVSDDLRDRRSRRMLDEMADHGVDIAYGPDLVRAAESAAERGWIEPTAAAEVRQAARAERS